jgi:hypothetical protein
VAILLALLLTSSSTAAHVDMIAPLLKVEKVYAAPKPLGKLRATYTRSEDGKEQGLLVECELFRRSVPANGLTDLPRPDWSAFYVAYSLTSDRSGKVKRPYLYLVVPLHGPVGTSWEQTWATFHFDADGKLTRRIKRIIPTASPNSVHVLWEVWEIGSGVSAEAVLDAAQKK